MVSYRTVDSHAIKYHGLPQNKPLVIIDDAVLVDAKINQSSPIFFFLFFLVSTFN